MKVGTTPYRTIWVKPDDPSIVQIIDQRYLPHHFVIENIRTSEEMATAIRDMHVRGAPLIGVAAAYGMYLAALHAPETAVDRGLAKAYQLIKSTRPTAVNLEWGLQRQLAALKHGQTAREKIKIAFDTAAAMADEDVEICRKIGEHGLVLIEEVWRRKKGEAVNILTHCNAGWLACVDWGTATSAVYQAHNKGIPVHVWVDETRPRNQGASLTAWELGQHGVPHTVIVDNAGGHLMQHGKVDLAIVGTDRTTRSGDVANKIGTYLKALAAFDNQVPFYAAVPSSSIDWNLSDGIRDIPIEERGEDEVKYMEGLSDGQVRKILVTPESSAALNYGFDVTPARLMTGLITERGIAQASEASLLSLFPEQKPSICARDEGVIKFNCQWQMAAPVDVPVDDLIQWRNELYTLNLIGQYEDGIGYGNISIRCGDSRDFVISGTQTGGIPQVNRLHFTWVSDYDIDQNRVTCRGPVKASSESLTHAMIYETDPEIRAVIHVHNKNLWQNLMNHVPTTAKRVAYGTPDMAREIRRLYAQSELKIKKILVMAGHEDGVIAFGKDLEEAARILLSYLKSIKS